MTIIPGRNRTGHGGNIHTVLEEAGLNYGDIIDFSANINPLGPPEWLRSMVSRELDKVLHYPDPDYRQLVTVIAKHYDVDEKCVVPANGSTDLLYLLPRILDSKRALVPVPSYIDYIKAVKLAGMPVTTIALKESDDFCLNPLEVAKHIQKGDLIIFASPNNPTGAIVSPAAILSLATDFPDSTFLVDEAFLDFISEEKCVGGKADNVLTLNSMTKFFGIPGLRLGFGVFPEKISQKVRDNLPPWTLNCLSQAFGIRCLQDSDYHYKSRIAVDVLRKELRQGLSGFQNLKVYPAYANYLLIRITDGTTAPQLAEKLLHYGILIRCCDNYEGLDETYFRIAVRNSNENEKLLDGLHAVYGPKSSITKKHYVSKTPAIMFQGTSSNAGKSVLTAALCRILLQDGVNVAPFKAQNMSLNSYVTRNGEEMGRAQVVQAQAAKLDPDMRMNPILLKPNSDTGSQIIVKGKPVGNMSVLDYGRYKPKAWEAVQSCYDSLASEYQAIVLEGAGSPGEVNLKAEDIVNMKMARYAESPVLLVGDIDRGGVYASFVGTMEVLSAWERELIAGFVVNRFRGDASLLESAHTFLYEHTGKNTFGVVPYVTDLGLPEEDSVSFKAGIYNRTASEAQSVDIVLLNFPHISNFTDVEPFLNEPDVNLRVVDSIEDLGNPDAIILPGSKNVIGDLRFLQTRGFEQALKKKADEGCEIVGICGGYQVLGKSIEDPLGIESSLLKIDAMGLIDITTELKAEKQLTRRIGKHILSGHDIYGYEIHHGISASTLKPALTLGDDVYCGSVSNNQAVWGSYLHGIFDSDSFRRWFIDNLREKKGFKRISTILAPYDLEASFDRVADIVRNNLDMNSIYRLLKL